MEKRTFPYDMNGDEVTTGFYRACYDFRTIAFADVEEKKVYMVSSNLPLETSTLEHYYPLEHKIIEEFVKQTKEELGFLEDKLDSLTQKTSSS